MDAKLNYIKNLGWVYNDTEFIMDHKTGIGRLTGNRGEFVTIKVATMMLEEMIFLV